MPRDDHLVRCANPSVWPTLRATDFDTGAVHGIVEGAGALCSAALRNRAGWSVDILSPFRDEARQERDDALEQIRKLEAMMDLLDGGDD